MRLIGDFIFLVLFVIFLVGWLITWAVFHVAGGGIHLLLLLAVVWLIAHFFSPPARGIGAGAAQKVRFDSGVAV